MAVGCTMYIVQLLYIRTVDPGLNEINYKFDRI